MAEQLFLKHPSWPVTDRDVEAASQALFHVTAIPFSSEYYFANDPNPFDPSNRIKGGVLYIMASGYVVVRLFVGDCLQLVLQVPKRLSLPGGLGKQLGLAFGGRMVRRGADREQDVVLSEFIRTPRDVNSYWLIFR